MISVHVVLPGTGASRSSQQPKEAAAFKPRNPASSQIRLQPRASKLIPSRLRLHIRLRPQQNRLRQRHRQHGRGNRSKEGEVEGDAK